MSIEMQDAPPPFTWSDSSAQQIISLFDRGESAMSIVTKILADTGSTHQEIYTNISKLGLEHQYYAPLTYAILTSSVINMFAANDTAEYIIVKLKQNNPTLDIITLIGIMMQHGLNINHVLTLMFTELFSQQLSAIDILNIVAEKTGISKNELFRTYITNTNISTENKNTLSYTLLVENVEQLFLNNDAEKVLNAIAKSNSHINTFDLIDIMKKSGLDEDIAYKLYGVLVKQLLDANHGKMILTKLSLDTNEKIDQFIHIMRDVGLEEKYILSLSRLKQPSKNPIDERDADYVFLEELGKGSFGVVTKARHKKSGEIVAIKKYLGGDIKTIMADLNAEIAPLLEISQNCSKHAVCYRGFYTEPSYNGTLYPRLVMDFIDGSPLRKYMMQIPVIERKRRHDILINLVKGLNFLHTLNIAHQDIKEDNIMWDKQTSSPKYVDWGLACISRQCCGYPCGTSGTIYTAPPELSSGHNNILNFNEAKAHDIWSIGVVIFNWYTLYNFESAYNPVTNMLRNNSIQAIHNKIAVIFPDSKNVNVNSKNSTVRQILRLLLDRNSTQRVANWVEVIRLTNILVGDGKQVAQMSKGHSKQSSVNFDAVVKSKQDLKNFSKKDLRSLAKYYSLPLNSPKDEIYWMLALNITKNHGL